MSGTTVTNSVNHESDARFETTAAWAAAETSTLELQRDVEKNAAKVHNAAEDAATHAHFKAPAAQGAVNQLEEGLADKTNQAVLEGQASVNDAKAASVGYVETARNLANSALSTAASYMPTSIGSTTATDRAASTNSTATPATGTGVVASLQSAAGTAVNTAANVLSSASAAAAPHLEAAKNTVTSAVSGSNANTSTTATKPSEVPPSTAPLETAGGVGGPYHNTQTGVSEGPTGIATV